MRRYLLEDRVVRKNRSRSSRTLSVFRIEGVVAMALNQLGANSRKPRDLESLGPSSSVLAGARTATARGPAAFSIRVVSSNRRLTYM